MLNKSDVHVGAKELHFQIADIYDTQKVQLITKINEEFDVAK